MQPVFEHPWDLDTPAARALQERLAARVERRDRHGPLRRIAGVDVSYDKLSPVLFAAVVVIDAETLETVESAAVQAPAPFPYVPGYLSFRELPPLVAALGKLQQRPDLVVCDGQGIAHPRRFGLACHLGVLFDVPAVGCAKSRFVGRHRSPGLERGRYARLMAPVPGEPGSTEIIGSVLRTRSRVKPLYVSIGHRVSLATCRRVVLQLAPKLRQPETTRRAHALVNRLRLEARATGEAGASGGDRPA